MGKLLKRMIVDLNRIVYPGNEYDECLIVLLPIKTADLERKNRKVITFVVLNGACIVVTSGSRNILQNKSSVNTCSIGGSA